MNHWSLKLIFPNIDLQTWEILNKMRNLQLLTTRPPNNWLAVVLNKTSPLEALVTANPNGFSVTENL